MSLRSSPATQAYLVTLAVATVTLTGIRARTLHVLIVSASMNLHPRPHTPPRVGPQVRAGSRSYRASPQGRSRSRPSRARSPHQPASPACWPGTPRAGPGTAPRIPGRSNTTMSSARLPTPSPAGRRPAQSDLDERRRLHGTHPDRTSRAQPRTRLGLDHLPTRSTHRARPSEPVRRPELVTASPARHRPGGPTPRPWCGWSRSHCYVTGQIVGAQQVEHPHRTTLSEGRS
jgi:hypothetical protein